MNEQDPAPANGSSALLTVTGPDVFVLALAYADTGFDLVVWETPPPVAGYAGAT
ncbi:hypothetical protein [Streptomyces sp. NPDC001165]|uniref:hypothetical protein n=1 Tax=Streptomyces sp. NPDC001165 TaxID=3364546 RepID=UPI00367728DF